LRGLFIGIILAAIVLGNAAYEAGNIAGASLGLESAFGAGTASIYPWVTGLLAFSLLWMGSYKALEQIFTGLVLLMSLSFAITAFLVKPDWSEVLRGLFIPATDAGSLLTVMALIGTTVVPYNLFLYTSLVAEKWEGEGSLASMRRDIVRSVVIGGAVSMAILITAAGSRLTALDNVMDLAASLEPVYGNLARYGIGVGLFAAGITSSITAPLAAAYVARQCFGWSAQRSDPRFRAVWMGVIAIGVLSHLLNYRPLEVIYFAQIANALLLPILAVFLWWAIRSRALMGTYRNNAWQDLLAAGVLLLVSGLALKTILGLWNP
jgi:Mn2+/Fe2+ NRAMP family transporter